jgi:hypothetical protein
MCGDHQGGPVKDNIFLVVGVMFFALYVFGVSNTMGANNHRYSRKDVAIAVLFPPYSWWVGGKELYFLTTSSSEVRQFEVYGKGAK